ncbi:DUF2497 domain-containing protein [Erythrobacter crassostreae]|uniref:DUF2497 domain-containing protein n=1 Tax=Erythrobacter crassostreae TaxID=2828328 RepID=A0A9X1F226_9SPHN|nr:DUF2497 domain-containing protein [Erythrobacter crassostrea]
MAHNEASVEEILESIKKVIARDNRESAIQTRKRREEDADRAEEDAQLEASSEDVLDLAEMELENLESPAEAGDTAADDESPLVTEEVRGAMQENLAALAMLSEPSARPQIVRSGETSLEDLTRELMRPMLAEWLDKNLPSMVEKMVQAEIARIAGKKA